MSVQDFPNGIVYSNASLCEFLLLRLAFDDLTVLDGGSDGKVLIADISTQELMVTDDNS